MPSQRVLMIAAGVAVLCLGYSVGKADSEVVYETKVVEKGFPLPQKTVTTTVTISEPIPEACLRLPSLADKVTEGDAALSGATGQIKLALHELGLESFSYDVGEVNAAIAVLMEQDDIIDASTIARAQAAIDLKEAAEQCQAGLPTPP